MQNLQIQKTFETPLINFDPNEGVLEIKGRSISDSIVRFYKPILEWIDQYSQTPHKKTVMKMSFLYYNSRTSRCILDILNKLDEMYKKGYDVKVEWCYDVGDESGMEDGEDFRDYVSMPIEIIEVKRDFAK